MYHSLMLAVVLGVASLAVFQAPVAAQSREFMDGVAAVVGDQVITVSDVVAETRGDEEALARKYSGKDLADSILRLRCSTVKFMMEHELIFQEFKAKEFKVPRELLQKRIDSIVNSQSGGSRELFEKSLFKQGMSFAEFETKVTQMVAVDLMVDEFVRRPVRISPYDVREYYNDQREVFGQPGRVRLGLLLVKKDGQNAGKIEETVKTIEAELQRKGDFAALAKQYSDGNTAADGGDLGWMKESDVQKDWRAAIQSLKPGETTGRLPLADGVVFLKLTEREAARIEPFTDVLAKQIESRMRRTEEDKRYKDLVASLRKRFVVKQFFDEPPPVPTAAPK